LVIYHHGLRIFTSQMVKNECGGTSVYALVTPAEICMFTVSGMKDARVQINDL
jgi:hypothetical protein